MADVKALAAHAATQDFSYNLVEHWHLGRQLQGIAAPIQEKILVGLDRRITAKIAEYRDRIRQRFDVPEPVKAEETRVAAMLNLVDPIQRELMFRLGYEICFSPETNADDIAFFHGIYGLHRKAANDLRDMNATYRIYFSGRGNLEDSERTLVHEIAHNLWPEQFSTAAINKIDQLAFSDQMRFMNFQNLMTLHYAEFEKLFNAYKAGSPQEQAAVIAATNQRFADYHFQAEELFPYLRDANDFRCAVKHAYDTLSIEGDRYNRSGYNTPEERFREVISRFAELTQVKYRGEPQFLQFLAPGLNEIWENQYLPHLARVNEALKAGTIPLTHVQSAATHRDADTNAKVAERPEPASLTKTPSEPGTPVTTGTPVITQVPTPPPVTATVGNPCFADDAPQSVVSNVTRAPANVSAALDALKSMGVMPQF